MAIGFVIGFVICFLLIFVIVLAAKVYDMIETLSELKDLLEGVECKLNDVDTILEQEVSGSNK